MSATSFQRKRRELLEQTSVAARMNEGGEGDPYAKTLDNYDEVGVKDEGTKHQQGDPPPYSETPHEPERLEAGQVEGDDPGAIHQDGEPPLTSVEEREGEEEPPYSDQERYDATDKRKEATAQASEENAEVGTDAIDATDGALELAESEGVDLAGVEGTGSNGRITKSDVEKYLEG